MLNEAIAKWEIRIRVNSGEGEYILYASKGNCGMGTDKWENECIFTLNRKRIHDKKAKNNTNKNNNKNNTIVTTKL